MAGIGVILWSIIEGPTLGWSSPLVIGAGAGGLGVLALFVGWERITDHPMLNLSFFRQRPAVSSSRRCSRTSIPVLLEAVGGRPAAHPGRRRCTAP